MPFAPARSSSCAPKASRWGSTVSCARAAGAAKRPSASSSTASKRNCPLNIMARPSLLVFAVEAGGFLGDQRSAFGIERFLERGDRLGHAVIARYLQAEMLARRLGLDQE